MAEINSSGDRTDTPKLWESLKSSVDARDRAYGAVYDVLHAVDDERPMDAARRNALVWRAVKAAIDAYEGIES